MDSASRTDSETETIHQSGSDVSNKRSRSKSGKDSRKVKRGEEIAYLKAQIAKEKAGKRKLFHSLVKVAKEFDKMRAEAKPLQQQADYADQVWYEGGMWRAPQVLPGVQQARSKRAHPREAISLSNLFFNIVVVTAFSRVGVAISSEGYLSASSFLYFAIFWSIWYKETSYSTRFDTTDLSVQISSLLVCFVVLFASLSASSPIPSVGGTRIMMAAGFCAFLNMCLMARVWCWFNGATAGHIDYHIKQYAIFNTMMNLAEVVVWLVGLLTVSESSPYRWMIFAIGVILSMRMPRAFMANDFHAACSKRGVLFLLLLGFMLQAIMVVASEFFQYENPSVEQYTFIGVCCLLLFCIKLLYVEDAAVVATDHALLINRTAGFFFHIGQFCLLLGMVVMGSGLNLLTHSYLAATAALPGRAKNLVCGGFGAVIFFIMFIKSMHLKRVPIDTSERRMFIAAYLVPVCTTLVIVGIMAALCFDRAEKLREILWRGDIGLLWMLSGCALLLVLLSWIDEALELWLWKGKSSEADGEQDYLIHPFGIWGCLHPEVSIEELDEINVENDAKGANDMLEGIRPSTRRLSALSPLLGESVASLRQYEAFAVGESERDDVV